MTAPPGVLGVVVWVLLALAALVVVVVAVGALLLDDLAGRLHLITPVTSVAGPLVGIACACSLGATTSTAAALVVVVLLAVTAPVLQSAVSRADREQDAG